ncbi:hypothetical protein GAU_2281 [Gemmatimonas aurantiaca T-27]|uniref:Uncharacterized protein n=1 Tax=Gemmatimonas aurantiaca (strain DSM 14586 / JCM 11422 / NBRC 100505 / T-27) TaxID=379066 RepID=C1AAR7_GEMAT|nr:hypothetical protein GAU_2281 [Gemmatimonas aurantiaca T-27]
MPVPYSTAAGWKGGKRPQGENKEALLKWATARAKKARQSSYDTTYAERSGAPLRVAEGVLGAAEARTARNIKRLAEIRGRAQSLVSMLKAVLADQQTVVDDLEPWSNIEANYIAANLSADAVAELGDAAGDLLASVEQENAQAKPKKKGRAE